MSAPCSLCLEDLTTNDPDRRYLRCVALPGRQPGLRLHTDGSVGWQTSDNIACELMVSLDQRLLLFRPGGAPPVRVQRARRTLNAPDDKPVVLLDGDEVRVAARRLRVHIHGETTRIAPPVPLLGRALSGGKSAAVMMAMGAAMLSCDRPAATPDRPSPAQASPDPLQPASVATVEPAAVASTTSAPAVTRASTATASAPPSTPPASTASRKRPPKEGPIEVRDMPPFAD